MFALVIITFLVACLILILGSAAYLLSAIIDDPDDDPAASTLGLDTEDFSRTPVTSPADGGLIQWDELRDCGTVCDCLKSLESSKRRDRDEHGRQAAAVDGTKAGAGAGTGPDAGQAVPIDTSAVETEAQLLQEAALLAGAAASAIANPEEIKSAEMNSKLLKASESQREPPDSVSASATSAASKTSLGSLTQSELASGLGSWYSSASAQKSIISGHLGNQVSKQIFDDFDIREMQLGGTALHWCKTRRSLERLIKLGMPLDIVNKRNETALHVAIRRHKLQISIGLLNHGADLECRNDNGETPLILACKVNDIFAAQLLLIYDADFDATDDLEHSARHYSANICDKHKVQQQLPSAAHLILAMLNEIGAKRCAPASDERRSSTAARSNDPGRSQGTKNDPATGPAQSIHTAQSSATTDTKEGIRSHCTDGCSHLGTYNGNSYGRWLNFKCESFNKRYMFADIIEAKRVELRKGSKARNSRMLCIDGGGLRGVIVCQIMIELERHLRRPVLSYFDWVGGTSVGAFIACAVCLGKSLREMRKVCFDFKDEVFSGSRPYNSKFLERALKRTLGTRTRLSEVKRHKLAFATVLADRDPCQLKIFRNYKCVAEMLEAHGLSADRYNNMTGQTTVSAKGRRNMVSRVRSGGGYKQASGVGGSTREPVDSSQEAKAGVAEVAPKERIKEKTSTSGGRLEKQNQTGRIDIEKESDGSIRTMNSASESESMHEAAGKSVGSKSSGKSELAVLKEAVESVLDEHEHDPIVWQAVRASAAAPFFFKPYGPYLDGGIISNNPTLDLLTEFTNHHKVRQFIRRHPKSTPDFRPNSPRAGEESDPGDLDSTGKLDLVVSLGTGRGRVIGRQAMVDFGQIASGLAAIFSPVELVRSIRAARDLFKRLMQQSCHTDDHILDRAQAWCASMEVPYFRLNPPLATIFSIDDKRDEQLINALWQTKLYMLSMKDQLAELAELLEGTRETNGTDE